MGIYTKVLNEGFFFSKEANNIKKQITEICKENKVDKSFLQRYEKSIDESVKKKTLNQLKDYFDNFHCGFVIVQTTTNEYGQVTKKQYYSNIVATKGNINVNFRLYYTNTVCKIESFKEITKSKIPQDVINKAFELCPKTIESELEISKNRISIVMDSRNRNQEIDFINKLLDYNNKKYSDNILKHKNNYIKFK